ncbi:ASCH domain-containing protein [Chryseobacterium defluvii]|uniref:ASCH domain-containing protein n=1 Tax=Chryseobacterium defluvii TaxID=160396 RepID=A0A495SMY5_9FLAO|nr:ASCH domain-containing protein [Chryseobacterium defluvii]RKT01075.1 ASCH domain-containing protein [Chryseobacterium defluvii]
MTKALSIKQPWASLIALGIKDIENRTWKTNFRGRIYIHSSGTGAKGKFLAMNEKQREEAAKFEKFYPLYFDDLQRGAIIGEVDIVDCVINHSSIWAEKTNGCFLENNVFYKKGTKIIYNWVLANAVLYDKPILNVKGKLSFWDFEKTIIS